MVINSFSLFLIFKKDLENEVQALKTFIKTLENKIYDLNKQNKNLKKKLATVETIVKEEKKKHKKKLEQLRAKVTEVVNESEDIKESWQDLDEERIHSLLFCGKIGDAKNSPVSFEMFWLCVQLVCIHNVPEKQVIDVIRLSLETAGMKPTNLPGETWVKTQFSSGRFQTFVWLGIVTLLNEYCEEDFFTIAADISSLKGENVNCVALLARLKSSKELIKIPVFIYQVITKAAIQNFELFETLLNQFEDLNACKYPNSPPIISRVTSSLGDKDRAEAKFMRLIEQLGLKLRAETNLKNIDNWVHGSCFQHNLDGKS